MKKLCLSSLPIHPAISASLVIFKLLFPSMSVYLLIEIDLCHSDGIQGRILPTQIQTYDIRMHIPLKLIYIISSN